MSDNKPLKWDLTHPPKISKSLSDEPQLEEWRRLMRKAVTAIKELEAQVAGLLRIVGDKHEALCRIEELEAQLEKKPSIKITSRVLNALKEIQYKHDDEWLPIETAPKDGTLILLLWGRNLYISKWEFGGWVSYHGIHPLYDEDGELYRPDASHWRPLPEPPKE